MRREILAESLLSMMPGLVCCCCIQNLLSRLPKLFGLAKFQHIQNEFAFQGTGILFVALVGSAGLPFKSVIIGIIIMFGILFWVLLSAGTNHLLDQERSHGFWPSRSSKWQVGILKNLQWVSQIRFSGRCFLRAMHAKWPALEWKHETRRYC